MTEMICIACPIGCTLRVVLQNGEYNVTGNTCKRGVSYAVEEMTDPRRFVTTTIGVINGEHALCAVKTANAVPKGRVFDVLKVIRTVRTNAPIHVGDVLLKNAADTGIDVVATANISKK